MYQSKICTVQIFFTLLAMVFLNGCHREAIALSDPFLPIDELEEWIVSNNSRVEELERFLINRGFVRVEIARSIPPLVVTDSDGSKRKYEENDNTEIVRLLDDALLYRLDKSTNGTQAYFSLNTIAGREIPTVVLSDVLPEKTVPECDEQDHLQDETRCYKRSQSVPRWYLIFVWG